MFRIKYRRKPCRNDGSAVKFDLRWRDLVGPEDQRSDLLSQRSALHCFAWRMPSHGLLAPTGNAGPFSWGQMPLSILQWGNPNGRRADHSGTPVNCGCVADHATVITTSNVSFFASAWRNAPRDVVRLLQMRQDPQRYWIGLDRKNGTTGVHWR